MPELSINADFPPSYLSYNQSGCKIVLYRYKVTYTASPSKDSEPSISTEYFATLKEVETIQKKYSRFGPVEVEELDTSPYEWLDGILISSDVNNPTEEAVKIFEMGQEAWESLKYEEKAKTPDQLRADVDFIAAMQGVAL